MAMSKLPPVEVVGYPQAGSVSVRESKPGETLGDKLARVLAEPVEMVKRPAVIRDVELDHVSVNADGSLGIGGRARFEPG